MNLSNTVMLAASTSRTNAYAQVMYEHNIVIKAAILFQDDYGQKAGQSNYVPERNWLDSPVFLPDISQSVSESLQKVCNNIIVVSAGHVNDGAVSEALKALFPELVIYSGYGSQIVGENILSSCSKLLHLHAGWLPDFRGSTTIYYHLLETGDCGVSAILLEKDIDMGPILARKYYPCPPPDLDIDYLYDGAIRADLLVNVLKHYWLHGVLPSIEKQNPNEGATYYIIHPVLKHIAKLSLEGR